ncbi:hypothetical protein O59_003620 [Cellvibrio sp. BR]|jgi:hypothetical protein|nr:hypothetical protein O59_003620 [Cellvibrio sp. BR]
MSLPFFLTVQTASATTVWALFTRRLIGSCVGFQQLPVIEGPLPGSPDIHLRGKHHE